MRTASLILCLAVSGLTQAIEPPAVPVEPTAQQQQAETRIAYVGVATSAATPALREQLGLPGGVVVDAIDTESPAQRAGLQVHDVITKIDDQLIINVHQFGVLVRLHKAGETVGLTVVRRGNQSTLNVQLAERVLGPGEEVNALQASPPRGGKVSSIVTQTDGSHVITLITHGDADRHVRIADPNGKVMDEGQLNTPEDHTRVPADCRAKVDAIEKNWERFKQLRNSAPAPKATPAPPSPVDGN